MRKLFLVAALLAASACDCGGGGGFADRSATLDPGEDLQFGTVSVGRSSTLEAVLRNSGTGALIVESVETAAPFTALFAGPHTLLGGETVAVPVTYTPAEPNLPGEEHVGELVVLSDSDTPRVSIKLIGRAVRPSLVLSPPALDFGEIEVGAIKDLILKLDNRGTEAVVIREARLDSAVFAGELQKLQTTLQPGASVSARLTYQPTAGQLDEATLVLVTDMVLGAEVPVALRGKGLATALSFCYRLEAEGSQQLCLPRTDAEGNLVYAGELDLGAIDEGSQAAASVTLTNDGNTQVALLGLESGGTMTADRTARSNPCGVGSPVADFTFAPATFGSKLPDDATEAEPNPPRAKSIAVTYRPHHDCSTDLSDTGRIVVRAGTGPAAKTFELVLRGASRIGQVYAENLFWQVDRPEQYPYFVYNIGPGPLQVTALEVVEGDEGTGNPTTDCTQRCAERAACAPGSTRVECSAFTWAVGPQAIEIPAAGLDPATGETEPTPGQVGTVAFTPPLNCADLEVPDPTCGPVLKGCMRIHSSDPYRGVLCAELKGMRLAPRP